MTIPASDKVIGNSGHTTDHNLITTTLTAHELKADPANTADKIQYVSTVGNDANSGLHWGKAKLTLQAAIDELSSGGTIYVGGGTFASTSAMTLTSELTIIGAGRNKTTLTSTGANLFNVTASLECVNFRSLELTSTDSHIFNVTATKYITMSSWHDVLFVVVSTSKSAVNMPDGEWIDNLVEHCEIRHSLTASVPTFNLVSSDNAINTNTFRRIRVLYSGQYTFHLDTSGGAYNYDNTFEDINFEVANGGCINLLSARNTLIKQCATYDLGTTTNHLYHIGKNAASPNSVYTTFIHCTRRGGTLGGGLKDIKIDASQGLTTLIGCDSSTGNGFTVDFQSSTGTVVGSTGTTLENTTSVTRMENYTVTSGQAVTGNRPSAATQEVGARFYDTTLSAPIWSDGSNWRLADGNTTTAWTAYTPTLAGAGWAVGNGTADGKYIQIGKTVLFRAKIVFGGTSTFGGAAPTISLPATAAAAQQGVLEVRGTDTGTTFYVLASRFASTTTVTLYVIGASGAMSDVTSVAPHAWASTDIIEISGSYEAA